MGNGPLGKVGRVYKQARKDEFKITLSMATKEEDVRMKWGDTETPAVTGKVWDYIGEQIRGEELQTIYDAGLEALTEVIKKKNEQWLRQSGKCQARTMVEQRKEELRNSAAM